MVDLTRCKQLIIYGGSFDPPHWAHIRLPMLVRELLNADAVLYVPAGRPPHKIDRRQTDASHRLAMLRLAIEDEPGALIIEDEIERARLGQPSYTIDTLIAIRDRLHTNVRMRLLIGSDQLAIWKQWKSYDRIEQIAPPAVMVRPPDTADTILNNLPLGMDKSIWRKRIIQVPAMDISATEIRKLARKRKAIEHLVPQPVADYIRSHKLYR